MLCSSSSTISYCSHSSSSGMSCLVRSVQDASSLETGSEYESNIDFGRELAVLHCVLCDCLNINEVSMCLFP